MPPKSLEKLEDFVTPAELLDEYAEHLFWWLNWMRKRRRSEPIEAQEDLWEAMKRRPDGLTKEQRKRLRELDALLKAHASWMVKVLGDELPKWRKRFKPPRSHWWWYLDKFVAR